MSDAARHIAQNEVILREVNERIAEKTMDLGIRGLAGEDETSEYLCACGRPDCDESLNLTLAQLEEAHARPDQFVVAPGHDLPEIEEVVAEHDEYCVVRKKPGLQAARRQRLVSVAALEITSPCERSPGLSSPSATLSSPAGSPPP